MIAAIASAFRSLNAQLLYRQGLVLYPLKASYLLSVFFFKWWTRRKRRETLTTIDNYDHALKIRVDVSKTMGAALYWTGFHEFNEMRFLNSYLKEDMVFVDVGANQGEFALFASRRLPKGKVLAFEPMSMFFDRLNVNIGLNNISNIKAYRLGLSDRAGEVPIYFNAGNASNHEGLASLFTMEGQGAAQEVIALARLDDIAGREGISKIDFIKIDVEGSEWAVLKGGARVLQAHRPALMVELNDETAARAGYRVEDMIAWLRTFGYEPFRIVRKGLAPLGDRPPFCNAVFLIH